MRPEVKERLIAALESGEFTQGFRRLHDFDTGCFCAIGVLTEVARRELAPAQNWQHRREYEDDSIQFVARDTLLQSEVIEWAGLTRLDDGVNLNLGQVSDETFARIRNASPDASTLERLEVVTLYTLNDLGVPFPMLADVIREAL